MSERVLEVNDLHVSFDITLGVQAVRGVDFYLNKGNVSNSGRVWFWKISNH